jgi:hypothetical protein
MKSDIKIISKFSRFDKLMVEFEDLKQNAMYYVEFDEYDEKYLEISIARDGEYGYTRMESFESLDLYDQNIIEDVLFGDCY